MPKHQPTLTVDLDATLAHYDGWCGREHIGEPLPGAVEAMRALVAAGYRILIYTCRCSIDVQFAFNDECPPEEAAVHIRRWLDEHGFPPELEVYLGYGKPLADFYCDDRALRVAPQDDADAWRHACRMLGVTLDG